MLRAVVAVTAVTFSIGLAARAGAEPRAAHPQPTPSALSPAPPGGAGPARVITTSSEPRALLF